jgi:hypothetical protein
MVTTYPPIRIVSPARFNQGTAQTPGSVRLAAVAPQLGIESALWGGLFEVQPGARTGIHHHGEQQTIAYVLSGICEVRWGARREGRMCRERESRRFHPCACLPATHGDQSVGCGAFSLGGREEHPNADRGQSSGRDVAIGKACGPVTLPNSVRNKSPGPLGSRRSDDFA